MGEVKKIGDEYFIEFFARGLKYQQKAGKNKGEAEQALKEIEEKIARGEAAIIVRDVDYDIFFSDFRENAALQHTERTWKRYTALLVDFENFLKQTQKSVQKLSQITPRTIELYKADLLQRLTRRKKINPQIFNLSLILLKDIFQYAIKLGYLNDNPTLHIYLLPAAESKYLNRLDQAPKWIFNLPAEFKLPLEWILLTGLKPSELSALQWQHVDFERQCLRVPGRQPDPNGIFYLPLTPQMSANVTAMKQSSQSPFVFPREFDWQAFCAELRLQTASTGSISLNFFRHAFAADLVKKGVPLTQLYKLLGEQDLARTLIYVNFIPVFA